MSEADNERITRRWVDEVWNRGIEGTIDRLMHPACKGHVETVDFVGPDGLRPHWHAIRTGFPDFRIEIEQLIAQRDDVVFRWNARGTHRGEFLGLPPSGRQVRFRGITWMRWEDGKMVEAWDRWNAGQLLVELGGVPST